MTEKVHPEVQEEAFDRFYGEDGQVAKDEAAAGETVDIDEAAEKAALEADGKAEGDGLNPKVD